jgi:hypothetical protein
LPPTPEIQTTGIRFPGDAGDVGGMDVASLVKDIVGDGVGGAVVTRERRADRHGA